MSWVVRGCDGGTVLEADQPHDRPAVRSSSQVSAGQSGLAHPTSAFSLSIGALPAFVNGSALASLPSQLSFLASAMRAGCLVLITLEAFSLPDRRSAGAKCTSLGQSTTAKPRGRTDLCITAQLPQTDPFTEVLAVTENRSLSAIRLPQTSACSDQSLPGTGRREG